MIIYYITCNKRDTRNLYNLYSARFQRPRHCIMIVQPAAIVLYLVLTLSGLSASLARSVFILCPSMPSDDPQNVGVWGDYCTLPIIGSPHVTCDKVPGQTRS